MDGEIVSTEFLGKNHLLLDACLNTSHRRCRHPQSIDALCTLPSSYPSSHSTILTGSSDGLLRAVQLFPTKLLGVVADHGSFPIERIAIDLGGEGRWVGSAGHDDTLKMTDLRDVFEDEEGEEAVDESENVQIIQASDMDSQEPDGADVETQAPPEGTATIIEASDSDEDTRDSHSPKEKKRKSKSSKNALAGRSKKARNQIDADPSFFKGL
jgi:hypothetical protein